MFGWLVFALFVVLYVWLVSPPARREARLALISIGAVLLVLLLVSLLRGHGIIYG